ncbi:hypothetical protein Nepgr_007940 [Nepenthes gracilis]|uniref:Uncharacterized protein n=1 Tax=Nepenthes gracilis TaxID=150966 RepID=A0AAD3S7T6_NEPGR|nr:hypothetical protein Nepgr_007940 [Nepenthes gracilis]
MGKDIFSCSFLIAFSRCSGLVGRWSLFLPLYFLRGPVDWRGCIYAPLATLDVWMPLWLDVCTVGFFELDGGRLSVHLGCFVAHFLFGAEPDWCIADDAVMNFVSLCGIVLLDVLSSIGLYIFADLVILGKPPVYCVSLLVSFGRLDGFSGVRSAGLLACFNLPN